jgi:predicted peroxiredoxin
MIMQDKFIHERGAAMKKIKGLLPVLAILFLLAGTVGADNGQVFINLTTDDPIVAAQALDRARQALQSGDAVTLFLSRDGAKLASVWNPPQDKVLVGKTPLQIISGLIREGAEVVICPKSMRNCRMGEYELIYGVERMKPETVRARVAASNGKMLQF